MATTTSAADWRCDYLTKEQERLRQQQHARELELIRLKSDLHLLQSKIDELKSTLVLVAILLASVAFVALAAWAGRGSPGA